MGEQHRYWFPAKRYGWGWGFPSAWQGRTAFGVFFVCVGAGAVMLLPLYGPSAFVAYCFLLCVLLVTLCWLKGEPPKWRARQK